MTKEEELRLVIEKKWDYLAIRKAISEVSGFPCMAVSTLEHIAKIDQRIKDQSNIIASLQGKLQKIKENL